jgi:hypothetical protein
MAPRCQGVNRPHQGGLNRMWPGCDIRPMGNEPTPLACLSLAQL